MTEQASSAVAGAAGPSTPLGASRDGRSCSISPHPALSPPAPSGLAPAVLIALLATAGCPGDGAKLDLPPPAVHEPEDGAAASAPVPATPRAPRLLASPIGALGGLAGAGTIGPLLRARAPSPELGLLPLDDVVREAQAGGRSGRYRVPAAEETERLESLARAILAHARASADAAPPLEELDRSAQVLGFRIVRASAGGERLLCLAEVSGINRGGGLYVFREAPSGAARGERDESAQGRLVVQAPHCFFDLHTGEIARALFLETRAAVLMLNTVHRRSRAENPARARGVEHAADLAHVEPSHFQAVTEAASKAIAGAVFVQVHGFASDTSDSRDQAPPADAAAIASKGEAWALADPLFDRLVASLATAFRDHGRVLVYPRDTRLLGATTNVQGRYLNGYSDDLFYHLEMSAPVREQLASDAALLRSLAESLRILEPGAPAER